MLMRLMKYGMMIDGEERNKAAPDTFEIPSKEDRETRFEGDMVKIGLEHREGPGERFWVKVNRSHFSKSGNTYYEGVVDNELTMFDIPRGEKIVFQPQNILSIFEMVRTAH